MENNNTSTKKEPQVENKPKTNDTVTPQKTNNTTNTNTGTRYVQRNNPGGNAPRGNTPGGYTPRPNTGGGYAPRGNNSGGGYAPRTNNTPGGYTPRTNTGGGYSPRPNTPGGFTPRGNTPGGYTPRPNTGGGYAPRTNNTPGGFTPRPNAGGGYTPRPNTPGGSDNRNSSQRPPFRRPFDKNATGGGQNANPNNRGGKRPPRRDNNRTRREDAFPDFSEKVVDIARVTKVVKGGRRFSFSAFVVVGNKKGRVGFGHGKANEVPDAIKKAIKDAQNNLIDVPVLKGTVPHEIQAKFLASKVMLKPASKGKGLIASGTVRAVVELAGYTDIVTKTYGSRSKSNTVKAAVKALKLLRTPDQIAAIRDKDVKELL